MKILNRIIEKSANFAMMGLWCDSRGIFVIARRIVDSPKQSTNANREFCVNLLLCVKLNTNNLLIHFWVIDFYFLLDSRDLDCHESAIADSRNDEVRAICVIWIASANLRFASQ